MHYGSRYINKSLLAAALLMTAAILFSCAEDDTLTQSESAGGVNSSEAENGGELSYITSDRCLRGVESAAPAVSTMYVDSLPEGYGDVSRITAYAADNDGIPYDLCAVKIRTEKMFRFYLPASARIQSLNVRALHENGEESGVYTIDLTRDVYGVKAHGGYYSLSAAQSSLPALFIETDMNHGTTAAMDTSPDHSVYNYGDMTLTVPASLAEERGWKTEYVSRENDPSSPGTMKMRGRGNWTWGQSKKPYQLTLEKKTSLLGMGKAKNYLLLANVMDASLLRDQVFYDLAADMGLEYSPDIEPVDLYINGEYRGSYSLSEKVEVGESRVDIDPETDFLIELDHYYYNEEYTVTTRHGKTFTIHNRTDSDSQEELTKILNKIESAVYSDGSDAFLSYLDLDSWVRYWWIQDLSKNNDSFIGSNYFYYVAHEGKLYAGPVWDMDNTLGIWGGEYNLKTKGWHCADRGWLGHLYKNKTFRQALEDYYVSGGGRELFYSLPEKIDEYAEYIRSSWVMNDEVNGTQYFVSIGCDSFEDDIAYMKSFIYKRLDFYDGKLIR